MINCLSTSSNQMKSLDGINQINVEMKHIICENWKQFNQIQFMYLLNSKSTFPSYESFQYWLPQIEPEYKFWLKYLNVTSH